MKTSFKTTMGQFAISGSATVTDEEFQILADGGTLQFTQRIPFSNAEKAMAGYAKRPAGFKRNTIPFTEDNVAKFQLELEKPIEIADGVTINLEEVEITQHVPTITEVKYAAERQKYASKLGDEKLLAKLASAVGYDGELGDGTADNAPIAFLESIKAWIKSQLESV